MGNVILTGKFGERKDDSYKDLVEDLMNDGIDYDEIEDMKEKVYELCEIGKTYAFGRKAAQGSARVISWWWIADESADVTIFYRHGAQKEFKGVAL